MMRLNLDPATPLTLTDAGANELERRSRQLSLRQRSVLHALSRLDVPPTVERVLDTTIYHPDEIIDEIQRLIDEGLVSTGADDRLQRPAGAVTADEADDPLRLEDGIVLSKARFLLIDFCVDTFGTRAEAFVDEIRACKDAASLSHRLEKVLPSAEKHSPESVPALFELVRRINETA
jgi:hypothetical protein